MPKDIFTTELDRSVLNAFRGKHTYRFNFGTCIMYCIFDIYRMVGDMQIW